MTGTLVHFAAAGDCTITATQEGDSNFNPAAPVARTFTIISARGSKVPYTVVADTGFEAGPDTGGPKTYVVNVGGGKFRPSSDADWTISDLGIDGEGKLRIQCPYCDDHPILRERCHYCKGAGKIEVGFTVPKNAVGGQWAQMKVPRPFPLGRERTISFTSRTYGAEYSTTMMVCG